MNLTVGTPFAARGRAMAEQLGWLFILALPIACATWTFTHEEIFRDVKEWLQTRSEASDSWVGRKFFFMWTCDYCLSHYVAAAGIAVTEFRVMLSDWRGSVLAWLAVTAVANVYLAAFAHLRVELSKERTELRRAETKARRAG
jgi:hypothetical protein